MIEETESEKAFRDIKGLADAQAHAFLEKK